MMVTELNFKDSWDIYFRQLAILCNVSFQGYEQNTVMSELYMSIMKYTSTIVAALSYRTSFCSMYDVDGNGWIDLGEMTKIVKSIYKMMGQNQAQNSLLETPEKRAEDIFQRMDINCDKTRVCKVLPS